MATLRWVTLGLVALIPAKLQAEPDLRDEARRVLKTAATYYRDKVAQPRRIRLLLQRST